ncbi:MAG: 50S ribosomal protein L18 [Candidatus Levybacteria bacterium]|nr:50S ribosomal protein L18 [Candidatus Levybacteria bacterium]MBI2420840.1 50S ribosomal protein L18 [Candidatus Levybacteria bacterium]
MRKEKNQKLRRQVRIRSKVRKNMDRPRISVFRSNKYIFAQIIDDKKKKTIIGVSEKQIKEGKKTKTERAKELGKLLAVLAQKKKISEAVFDRGSYSYHGRVKAVADGLREGGMKF